MCFWTKGLIKVLKYVMISVLLVQPFIWQVRIRDWMTLIRIGLQTWGRLCSRGAKEHQCVQVSHLTSAPSLFPSLSSFHLRGQITYSQCGEWIFISCFNFNFLFIICVFHIKHLNPIHFPPLCIHPLPRQQLLNRIKFKRKKKKSQSCHESCSVTQ